MWTLEEMVLRDLLTVVIVGNSLYRVEKCKLNKGPEDACMHPVAFQGLEAEVKLKTFQKLFFLKGNQQTMN